MNHCIAAPCFERNEVFLMFFTSSFFWNSLEIEKNKKKWNTSLAIRRDACNTIETRHTCATIACNMDHFERVSTHPVRSTWSKSVAGSYWYMRLLLFFFHSNIRLFRLKVFQTIGSTHCSSIEPQGSKIAYNVERIRSQFCRQIVSHYISLHRLISSRFHASTTSRRFNKCNFLGKFTHRQ